MSDTVVSNELFLFENLPILNQFVHSETIAVQPNVFQSKSPGFIAFSFNSGGSSFLLNRFILKSRFYLTKTDGTDLVGDDKAAPLHLAPLTNFKNVSLKIQDVICESYNGLFPYVADFLFNYSYGSDAQKTWLPRTALFYPDKTANFDTCGQTNDGWHSRQDLFELSKRQTTMVQLPFAISASQRIFLPNLDFMVTLEHANDDFRIMSATPAKNYKLVYEKAELLITKCWLKDHIVQKLFDKFYGIGYCLYPCKRFIPIGPFFLASGQTQFHAEISRGQKPIMLFCMWVESSAQMGNYAKNFANYKPLQVKYAMARYGAQQVAGFFYFIAVPNSLYV